MKKETPVLEYIILGIVIAVFLLFMFQMTRGNINLARSVFNGLVNGKYEVAKNIDWEELRGLSIDAGSTYSKFKTDEEKTGYKKAFILGFSKGFKQIKGDAQSFVNWRILSKEGNQVIIAADYKVYGKTLLMTFSGAKKKLTSLQWEVLNAKK